MPRNLSVQLKRKWDKESLERGKRGRERHKCGEREEERDNHSACWTLTVCEASIIHAAVHMSRAHRQAQQQGRAQIKQRIHGHAHNAPGGTHLDPFLCCSRINREQGYLSAAWFSSRAKSCWNSLCLFFVFFFSPPLYLLASFWQGCWCLWAQPFHGSLVGCLVHFTFQTELSCP